MDDGRLGRAVRVLRQRRGWRPTDLARVAAVSQAAISAIERGAADRFTLGTLRAVLAALGARGYLDVRWGGLGDLDRLLDRDHAALVTTWAERHARGTWEIWPEASFSIYGERGRIDMLGFHAPTRTLEVAECKTGIWDVSETLGRLDVKARLAARVAADRGWRAGRVVRVLVVAEGRTTRRRIAAARTLFGGFDLRGRDAARWLADPTIPGSGGPCRHPIARYQPRWT